MTSQSNTHHLMDFTLSRRQKHQFTNGTILIASLGHFKKFTFYEMHFKELQIHMFMSVSSCLF